MVQLTAEDLRDEEEDIQDFLSDDSDVGLTPAQFQKKLAEEETLVVVDETFPAVVVVGGLPLVDQSKYENLKKVTLTKVVKTLQKRDADFSAECLEIELPTNEEGSTLGCALVTFPGGFEAKQAVSVLNHMPFDRKHILKSCLLDDFNSIVNRDEASVQKEGKENSTWFTRKGLRWCLLQDEEYSGFEQFFIRYKKETEVHWNDPVGREPILINKGEENRKEGKVWTMGKACWSPQGSFLATFHKEGIALWGREHFIRLARIRHKDCREIFFSPNEEYVMTYDGSSYEQRSDRAIQIWRVINQEMLRTFQTPEYNPRGEHSWPYFVWSNDTSYLAGTLASELDTISIFKTPDLSRVVSLKFELRPRGPLPRGEAPGSPRPSKSSKAADRDALAPCLKFEWSPSQNILAVFVPQKSADTPSRVVLYEIPSKEELSNKDLYNVREASMHWQSKGAYMALVTVLFRKTGKKKCLELTQIEIFRLREKNVPVDTVQIEGRRVQQFQWEPNGSRLAILVQDEVTHGQLLQFYAVKLVAGKRETQLVACTEVLPNINAFQWSPLGSNYIAAALGNDGTLIFGALTDQNKIDIYHRDEHFQVNQIMWDSSGRFITTAVQLPITTTSNTSHWRYGRDAGFQIWTFQGRLLHSRLQEDFYIFQWRPRPGTLLSPEKEREVHKHLKEYSRRFDEIDEQKKQAKREEFLEGRRQIMEKFWGSIEKLKEWKKSHELYDEWEKAAEDFESKFEYDVKKTMETEVLERSAQVIS